MMLDTGWVKLHRSLLNWEWYDDINTKTVFLHLLLTVSIEDSKWHGITIPRGSRIASYAKIAEETKLSVKEVRTAINHLERTNEVARVADPNFTVFTIKNYDRFQGRANDSANEGQTRGKARANEGQQYKKVKEDKEDSKKCMYAHDASPASHVPTPAAVKAAVLKIGAVWDDAEIERFIEYNAEKGWKVSLPYAVKSWERNRQKYQQTRKRPEEPEMTAREIEEMNEYLSLVNRFRKE